MLELLKPYLLLIGKWGGIALAGIILLFKTRKDAQNAIQKDQLQKILDDIMESKHVEETIDNSSDSKLDQLRKKWTRE